MGYESVIMFCTVATLVVTVASFVLDLIKALTDKKDKDE